MGWWRKASYQNNVEEVVSCHHSQKIDFPSTQVRVFTVRQWPCVLVATQLNLGLNIITYI